MRKETDNNLSKKSFYTQKLFFSKYHLHLWHGDKSVHIYFECQRYGLNVSVMMYVGLAVVIVVVVVVVYFTFTAPHKKKQKNIIKIFSILCFVMTKLHFPLTVLLFPEPYSTIISNCLKKILTFCVLLDSAVIPISTRKISRFDC